MKIANFNGASVDELIFKVKQGNELFLRDLYELYRAKFTGWFQKNYRLEKPEAIELYQKTFTIFYFNVKDEKITTLQSGIQTYLIGIGKNLVKEKFREKIDNSLDEVADIHIADYSIFKDEEENHKQTLVKKLLDKLEEPCKTILSLYYFRNFSLESIAHNLGYKNEGVVKKKKCLCLKKIREDLASTKKIS